MRQGTRSGDGEVSYLHGDHLGTASAISDNSGTYITRTLNLPFGGVRWSSGESPTDFGFTGQRLDTSTGLMFYNARYYSPAIGRFISADTIVPGAGNPQGLNRYAYVANNPVKYTDPNGHIPVGPMVEGICAPESCLAAPRSQARNFYGISFTGAGWDTLRMVAVVNAATKIDVQFKNIVAADAAGAATQAARFADPPEAHRRLGMFDSLYRGEAFRAAFGSIELRQQDDETVANWGETRTTNTGEVIDVYNGAFDENARFTFHFPAHELGHAFAHRTGGPDGTPRVPYSDLGEAGFGDFEPGRPWQQSALNTVNEDFADMFVGWAGNHLEVDRYGWMNDNMARWTALAITENR